MAISWPTHLILTVDAHGPATSDAVIHEEGESGNDRLADIHKWDNVSDPAGIGVQRDAKKPWKPLRVAIVEMLPWSYAHLVAIPAATA